MFKRPVLLRPNAVLRPVAHARLSGFNRPPRGSVLKVKKRGSGVQGFRCCSGVVLVFWCSGVVLVLFWFVWGVGFEVQGSGFQGSGFRVQVWIGLAWGWPE